MSGDRHFEDRCICCGEPLRGRPCRCCVPQIADEATGPPDDRQIEYVLSRPASRSQVASTTGELPARPMSRNDEIEREFGTPAFRSDFMRVEIGMATAAAFPGTVDFREWMEAVPRVYRGHVGVIVSEVSEQFRNRPLVQDAFYSLLAAVYARIIEDIYPHPEMARAGHHWCGCGAVLSSGDGHRCAECASRLAEQPPDECPVCQGFAGNFGCTPAEAARDCFIHCHLPGLPG